MIKFYKNKYLQIYIQIMRYYLTQILFFGLVKGLKAEHDEL